MKLIILACSIALAFAANHGHHGHSHAHHHDHPNGKVPCSSNDECYGCLAGTSQVCMTDGLCKCLQQVPVYVRQVQPICTSDSDCTGTLACVHGEYCHQDHGHILLHTGHCQCHDANYCNTDTDCDGWNNCQVQATCDKNHGHGHLGGHCHCPDHHHGHGK